MFPATFLRLSLLIVSTLVTEPDKKIVQNIYLHILNVGLIPEADNIPDIDDPQDEQVEK